MHTRTKWTHNILNELWSWNTFSIQKLTNPCLQVGVWGELCVCKLCVGHRTREFPTEKPFIDCCPFICEAIYNRVHVRYTGIYVDKTRIGKFCLGVTLKRCALFMTVSMLCVVHWATWKGTSRTVKVPILCLSFLKIKLYWYNETVFYDNLMDLHLKQQKKRFYNNRLSHFCCKNNNRALYCLTDT